MVNREPLIGWQPDVWPTFNAGHVDLERDEFLPGPLDTLVNRLDDLVGVLLHPPGSKAGQDVNFVVLEMIQGGYISRWPHVFNKVPLSSSEKTTLVCLRRWQLFWKESLSFIQNSPLLGETLVYLHLVLTHHFCCFCIENLQKCHIKITGTLKQMLNSQEWNIYLS